MSKSLYIGGTEIAKISLGDTQITRAYIGDVEVFSEGDFVGLKVTSEIILTNFSKTARISVRSSEPWYITNKPSWVELSQTSGDAGKAVITVTVSDTDEDREGNIFFETSSFEDSTSISQSPRKIITEIFDIDVASASLIPQNGEVGCTGLYDLGYLPTPNTSVYMVFKPMGPNQSWAGLLGTQLRDDDDSTYQLRYSSNSNALVARIGSEISSDVAIDVNKYYMAILDARNTDYTTPSPNTLAVNGIHNNSWADWRYGPNHIYNIWIYEGDTLVRTYTSRETTIGDAHLWELNHETGVEREITPLR